MTSLFDAIEKGQYSEIQRVVDDVENIDNVICKDADGNNLLMAAVTFNQLEIFKILISSKSIDINWQNKDGFTALMFTVVKNRSSMASLLLSNPLIEPNKKDKDGQTALMLCVILGQSTILREILGHEKTDPNVQDNDKDSALSLALLSEHVHLAWPLLEHPSINPNLQNMAYFENDVQLLVTPLMYAVSNGLIDVANLFLSHKYIDLSIQDGNDNSAFLLCARHGHVTLIPRFIEHMGLNVNVQDKYERTALLVAADHESDHVSADMISFILQHPDVDTSMKDKDGNHAIILALQRRNIAVINMLLQKETDVNTQDSNGCTALFLATMYGYPEVVKSLLDHTTTDPNMSPESGTTPLMKASEMGYAEIASFLLQHKSIDVNKRDRDGNTALSLAIQKNHSSIVSMILNEKQLTIGVLTENKFKLLSDILAMPSKQIGRGLKSLFRRNRGLVDEILQNQMMVSLMESASDEGRNTLCMFLPSSPDTDSDSSPNMSTDTDTNATLMSLLSKMQRDLLDRTEEKLAIEEELAQAKLRNITLQKDLFKLRQEYEDQQKTTDNRQVTPRRATKKERDDDGDNSCNSCEIM